MDYDKVDRVRESYYERMQYPADEIRPEFKRNPPKKKIKIPEKGQPLFHTDEDEREWLEKKK